MSLIVNHLNADSTFLLTFAPPYASAPTSKRSSANFTVLVDPWLDGHYMVWRPSFAIAFHTQEPSISSLADVKDLIDLIVISQDKSDHCHRETLCSLPRNSRTMILATPAAAKKIRSWKHFDNPDIVRTIPSYNANRPESIIRIPVDAYHTGGAPGEVTIVNMPTKIDMASLHNAIGITYCPPAPPTMRRPRPSTTNTTQSATSSISDCVKYDSSWPISLTTGYDGSLDTGNTSINRERVLSVLYSPHGVSRSTVQPYVSNHLATLYGALPLTALFHSINSETNPWIMGGVVSAGAPGGVKLAKALRAKYWIGAHDEVKDVSGVATRFIRKEQFDLDAIYERLRDDKPDDATDTEVVVLGCGEERRFDA